MMEMRIKEEDQGIGAFIDLIGRVGWLGYLA
jgi:hypothetical protein